MIIPISHPGDPNKVSIEDVAKEPRFFPVADEVLIKDVFVREGKLHVIFVDLTQPK